MQVNAIVGEVIPTRVQMTFSQLQNFIASIAIERDYKYYFWGHADVALVASNATASFAEEVLQCVASHFCRRDFPDHICTSMKHLHSISLATAASMELLWFVIDGNNDVASCSSTKHAEAAHLHLD